MAKEKKATTKSKDVLESTSAVSAEILAEATFEDAYLREKLESAIAKKLSQQDANVVSLLPGSLLFHPKDESDFPTEARGLIEISMELPGGTRQCRVFMALNMKSTFAKN